MNEEDPGPAASTVPAIRCRVAACREALGDGREWSFYVLNDGEETLDSVVLETFGHEWGGVGRKEHPKVRVEGLAPGAHARIWRDNDNEVRMWMKLAARAGRREVELEAEFPLLYRHLDELEMVPELGKPGWVASAVILTRAG